MQPDDPEVPAHQLQTAIGSKPLACEFNRQVLLDHPPQPHYLQPHLWGLPCRLDLRGQRFVNYARKALFLQPFGDAAESERQHEERMAVIEMLSIDERRQLRDLLLKAKKRAKGGRLEDEALPPIQEELKTGISPEPADSMPAPTPERPAALRV